MKGLLIHYLNLSLYLQHLSSIELCCKPLPSSHSNALLGHFSQLHLKNLKLVAFDLGLEANFVLGANMIGHLLKMHADLPL